MSHELGRLLFVVFLITQFFQILMAVPVVMDWLLMALGLWSILYLTYEYIHAYKEATK